MNNSEFSIFLNKKLYITKIKKIKTLKKISKNLSNFFIILTYRNYGYSQRNSSKNAKKIFL